MTENHPSSEHPGLLEELRAAFNHSIRILDSPHPIEDYTCLMHAMAFDADPRYRELATPDWLCLSGIYAGPHYARWLLSNKKLMPTADGGLTPGCLVLYFASNAGGDLHWRHAAIHQLDGWCISKWGMGHLYGHLMFEVPASYGSQPAAFDRPSGEEAIRLFIEYRDWRLAAGQAYIRRDPDDD